MTDFVIKHKTESQSRHKHLKSEVKIKKMLPGFFYQNGAWANFSIYTQGLPVIIIKLLSKYYCR